MIIRVEVKVQVATKHTHAALRTVREWTVSKTTIAQAATVCGVVCHSVEKMKTNIPPVSEQINVIRTQGIVCDIDLFATVDAGAHIIVRHINQFGMISQTFENKPTARDGRR